MDQPFEQWLANSHRGFNAPLDIAVIIASHMETPQDIINYALSHRELLDHWIDFSGAVRDRLQIAGDPESNPRAFEPNPVPADPTALAAQNREQNGHFLGFAKVVIGKLFSPAGQRCLLTTIVMPNSSHRIWDVDYRRANPSVGDAVPFPDLYARKRSRFMNYWGSFDPQADNHLLFSFKTFNRISPIVTACRRFAIDFMKKAGTQNPSLAHHSPPEFAHPSLSLSHEVFRNAAALMNETALPDFNMLHETEQERLLSSFYMYETLCAMNLKVTGYDEVAWTLARGRDLRLRVARAEALRRAQQIAINTGQPPPDTLPPGTPVYPQPYTMESWNFQQYNFSPIIEMSGCQVERVRCVYTYVKTQYHLMFYALFMEWRHYLGSCSVAYSSNPASFASQDSTPRLYATARAPLMFRHREALDEWVDILCSRGLVFLHEVLCMPADQRRQMLVNSFYPTRWAQGPMRAEDYLVKGIFDCATWHHDMMMNRNTNISHSDEYERALEQNWSWVKFMVIPTREAFDIRSDYLFHHHKYNPLRRRGWVFWNKARCQSMGLDLRIPMEQLCARTNAAETPPSFLNGAGWLDQPDRLSEAHIEFTASPATYPEAVWQQAMIPFSSPSPPPARVELPILGETLRIWSDLDANGNPVFPSII